MRIKVETDSQGNCSKHCPHIKPSKGGIPIMVGGGLCVHMCVHYMGNHLDNETKEIFVDCNNPKNYD